MRHQQINLRWLIVIIVIGLSSYSVAGRAAVTGAQEASLKCEALRTADFSAIEDAPTELIGAKFVEATADVPSYCQVSAFIVPNVGFGLRLPGSWNGKFMHIGCGSACGNALEDSAWPCTDALRRGYACLTSDMGHKGAAGDVLWADHNLQAKVDWGYRATHVATLAGKAITQYYYSRGLGKSYFIGCSTGGRQALQTAQHFPWDFDGIVAGAPASDMSELAILSAWMVHVTRDHDGGSLLGTRELELLTAAAVKKCDLDDGVKDGVIGDPMHCSFDPSVLVCKARSTEQCLTAAQVDAARKIYAGPVNSRGEKLTLGGPLPGSEADWTVLTEQEQERFFTDLFRYAYFASDPGSGWKLSDFNFDRDYRRMGVMEALTDGTHPDLRKFKAAGGKLIAYVGMSDGSSIPRATLNYYETVERTLGGGQATQDFFRLFLAPGMNHCTGGVGADRVDLLTPLEAWVEHGHAPDRLVAAKLKESSQGAAYPYTSFPIDPASVSFTRPMYPYPTRTSYLGHGSPADASNFGAANK